MEFEYNNLNGFEDNGLPDIVPGTKNELIAVNASESGYELIPTDVVIPEPNSGKQVLNSTAGNVWGWNNDPLCASFTADGGSANGYKFDGTNSTITSEFNIIKIKNLGVERINCTGSGVELKGGVSVDNLITVPVSSTFGIGSSALNKIEFGSTNISLRANNTIRVQATGSGVTLVGNISQNVGSNTNTFSGTVTVDSLTSATNFKATNAGTISLNSVRIVDDNTGLYQSAAGDLNITASGSVGLNLDSSRVQTRNIFNFSRGPAFSAGIYNIAQANNIVTSTQPLLIVKTPTTGFLDLDFGTGTSYFGGQQFQIIIRDVGAGTVRYRAQSTTYHVTGGAAIVTIAANTYHTFVNDRYHILICNVDSNSFYLIQT